MKREEYNACVAEGLRGKKMAKEARKLEFCAVAKTCSGKAKTHEEALQVCRLPKAPKPEGETRSKKKKADCDFDAIAACAAPKIIGYILETPDVSITPAFLAEIFAQCSGGNRQPKKLSREGFIKKCFKEHSNSGTVEVDIKEAAKLRTFCIAEYKKLVGETVHF